MLEAQIILERWGKEYNTIRPHSSLGYVSPASEAILPTRANQIDPNRENYQIQVVT